MQFFEYGDAEAGFYQQNDRLYVSFRGTDLGEINDVMADLDTSSCVYFDGKRCHRGFFEYVSPLFNAIISRLTSTRCEIIVTGHSLGGAMALLFAIECMRREIRIEGLVTFGQPRALCPSLASWFEQMRVFRYYRLVNDNDVVTKLPPRCLGFVHCGTVVYSNEIGQLKVCETSENCLEYLNSLWIAFKRLDFSDAVDDHYMTHYVRISRTADAAVRL